MADGYVVFTVRARVPRVHGQRLRPLGNLDGNGGDLLFALGSAVRQIAAHPLAHKDDRYNSAFRLDPPKAVGRTLTVEGTSGNYGTTGQLEHVDTGDSQPIAERQAAMRDLRAMFVVPTDGEVGLLFAEIHGRASLRRALFDRVLVPAAKHYDVAPMLNSYFDPDAWRDFLDSGRTKSVTAVYRPQRIEDSASFREAGELRFSATGQLAESRGNALLRSLSRKLSDANAVLASSDLDLAEPPPGYALAQTQLQVTAHGKTRRILFDPDGLPQWVYEWPRATRAGRPSLGAMQSTWRAEAERIFSSEFGVTMPSGWHTGQWPAAARGVQVSMS